jgi:hypothetical protein
MGHFVFIFSSRLLVTVVFISLYSCMLCREPGEVRGETDRGSVGESAGEYWSLVTGHGFLRVTSLYISYSCMTGEEYE